MQSKGEITKPSGFIDIRVFAHATEDPEKVQIAVHNLLPVELAEILVFQKSNLTGHYGNPIILFMAKLTDKRALPTVLEKIGSSISSLDKEALDKDIKLHLEKRNMYLRFDKQSAYCGKIKFCQIDPIHMKIHFKNKSNEEIMEICKNVGLLP